mgnify:CR=1 FL=1|jgi:Zn-finger domain-containing protein
MNQINQKDLFGRPINQPNQSSLYDNNGQLKEMFKPKEIKHNRLEKQMIKSKEKANKFL